MRERDEHEKSENKPISFQSDRQSVFFSSKKNIPKHYRFLNLEIKKKDQSINQNVPGM